jgi:hypothetical protein
MESLRKTFRWLFKVALYITFFAIIILFAYKYINWTNIMADIRSSSSVIASSTSEFSPETLMLGLDYNGSKWVEELKSHLTSSGYEVKSITASSTDKKVIEALINNGPLMRFSSENNFDKVWSNFNFLKSNKDFNQELEKGIEYIDFRYDNKVYYKLIRNIFVLPTTSTTTLN